MTWVPTNNRNNGPPLDATGGRAAFQAATHNALAKAGEAADNFLRLAASFLAAALVFICRFLRETARVFDIDSPRGAAAWVVRLPVIVVALLIYGHLTASALRTLSPELAVRLSKWIPAFGRYVEFRRLDFALVFAWAVLAVSVVIYEMAFRFLLWPAGRNAALVNIVNALAAVLAVCDVIFFGVAIAGGGFNASPAYSFLSTVALPVVYTCVIIGASLLVAFIRGDSEESR